MRISIFQRNVEGTMLQLLKTKDCGARSARAVLCAVILACAHPAAAAPEPPGAPAHAVVMSLQDCLKAALQNNPDIEIQAINVIIAQKEVAAEDAAFDPDFSAILSLGDSRRPTASIVTGNRRETAELSFGYGKSTRTGDEFGISLSQIKQDTNSAFSSLNPSFTLDLGFDYTHRLGRGSGREVALSRLRAAAVSREMSELDLKNEIMNIAYRVESAYWSLVYAQEALEVRKDSLALADKTLEQTRAMVDAGALAQSQILLVETERAQREESVIAARGAVSRALLNLKLVMNAAGNPALWDAHIVPGGPAAGIADFEPLPFEQGLERALRNRPDYLGAMQGLEIRRIVTRTAQDALRPSINLVTSLDYGGLKDTYTGSVQDISSLQYPSWSMGLWLDLPLGRRQARARLEQTRGDQRKAELAIEKARQGIAVDIADAAVGLDTARNRAQAAAVSREYAEKRLAEEVEKLTLGIATTHDVLEYQQDLAEARLNETQAAIDCNRAVLEYHYALGTLLEVNRIQVRTGLGMNNGSMEAEQ